MAVGFALDNLQQRGTMFVQPGDDIYQGMIIGENARSDDMVVNPCKAKALTNQGIAAVTGKALKSAVLDASWTHLTFTLDPIASSLKKSASDAEAAGLLERVLSGHYRPEDRPPAQRSELIAELWSE